MRSGSCKFSSNCRFDHPDPIAVEGQESLSGCQIAESPYLYLSMSSRPPNFSNRSLNESASFSNASPSYLLPFQPKEHSLNPKVKNYEVTLNCSTKMISIEEVAEDLNELTFFFH